MVIKNLCHLSKLSGWGRTSTPPSLSQFAEEDPFSHRQCEKSELCGAALRTQRAFCCLPKWQSGKGVSGRKHRDVRAHTTLQNWTVAVDGGERVQVRFDCKRTHSIDKLSEFEDSSVRHHIGIAPEGTAA